eukprot:1159926-Pelagomonas_calceolata.AAC.5
MKCEELQPLVEKYLASIPPAQEPKPKDTKELTILPWSFPKETVVEDFKVGYKGYSVWPSVWVSRCQRGLPEA